MDQFSVFYNTSNETSEGVDVSNYDVPMSTGKQRAFIHGLLNKVNMDEQDLYLDLGFDIISMKDMTSRQASEAIEYLKEIRGY